MAQFTVVKRGDLKQAGPNWLKLKVTLSGPEGQSDAFVWCKSADAAGKYTEGSVWNGELSLRKSKDPQYDDEHTFKGEMVSAGVAPPAAAPTHGNPVAAGFVDDKDNRISRQNSANAAASFLSGTKAEIGDFWALARQIAIYDISAKVVPMSTKTQHEAILAMFTRVEGDKRVPDVEAAHQAVFEFSGVYSLRALTFTEAAAFLESMTPDLPSL
jgi:hypothetical protein